MSGDKTAIALALEEKDPEPEARQIELLGIAESDDQQLVDLRAKRSAKGRPPGARNRRTLEMANFLLSRYTSPLEVLAQIATARVDELSRLIGCTKLEALQEKRLAALGLLPYLHQKMPVAVDVTNTKIVHLTIVDAGPSNAGVHGEEDVITVAARLVDAQEREDADDGGGDGG